MVSRGTTILGTPVNRVFGLSSNVVQNGLNVLGNSYCSNLQNATLPGWSSQSQYNTDGSFQTAYSYTDSDGNAVSGQMFSSTDVYGNINTTWSQTVTDPRLWRNIDRDKRHIDRNHQS